MILAYLLLSTTGADTTSVQPGGSFLRADLPGETHAFHKRRQTLVGEVVHHTVEAEAGDAALSLTATQVPGIAKKIPASLLYLKARKELLNNFDGADRTSWSSCRVRGHACRHLDYDLPSGRQGEARFFLSDGVLVVANALYDEDQDIAEEFHASVR